MLPALVTAPGSPCAPTAKSEPALKILVSGSVGAGKTTAIHAVSEIRPAGTDVPITSGDRREGKLTTTVGIDYGELTLPGLARLSLFGTPGQERYDFLIRSVAEGAAGLLILVDHQSESPLSQLEYYLKTYADLIPAHRTIIGLTHASVPGFSIESYVHALRLVGICDSPVPVDARDAVQVRQILERLAMRCTASPAPNGVAFR